MHACMGLSCRVSMLVGVCDLGWGLTVQWSPASNIRLISVCGADCHKSQMALSIVGFVMLLTSLPVPGLYCIGHVKTPIPLLSHPTLLMASLVISRRFTRRNLQTPGTAKEHKRRSKHLQSTRMVQWSEDVVKADPFLERSRARCRVPPWVSNTIARLAQEEAL